MLQALLCSLALIVAAGPKDTKKKVEVPYPKTVPEPYDQLTDLTPQQEAKLKSAQHKFLKATLAQEAKLKKATGSQIAQIEGFKEAIRKRFMQEAEAALTPEQRKEADRLWVELAKRIEEEERLEREGVPIGGGLNRSYQVERMKSTVAGITFEVTNKSDHVVDHAKIDVEFNDADGRRVANGSAFVQTLRPGESQLCEVAAFKAFDGIDIRFDEGFYISPEGKKLRIEAPK